MGKLIDLTGRKFGKLTVLGFAEIKNKRAFWKCRCDCGNISITDGGRLRDGGSKSCGCRRIDNAKRQFTSHGFSKLPEYKIWKNIITRCTNSNARCYKNYGGRGITICEAWRNSFVDFFSHVGKRPSRHHQIDRINNDKNYEPGNVRWATDDEQRRNKRVIILEHNGKRLSVVEWAKITGIPISTIRRRFQYGWSAERILNPAKWAKVTSSN